MNEAIALIEECEQARIKLHAKPMIIAHLNDVNTLLVALCAEYSVTRSWLDQFVISPDDVDQLVHGSLPIKCLRAHIEHHLQEQKTWCRQKLEIAQQILGPDDRHSQADASCWNQSVTLNRDTSRTSDLSRSVTKPEKHSRAGRIETHVFSRRYKNAECGRLFASRGENYVLRLQNQSQCLPEFNLFKTCQDPP